MSNTCLRKTHSYSHKSKQFSFNTFIFFSFEKQSSHSIFRSHPQSYSIPVTLTPTNTHIYFFFSKAQKVVIKYPRRPRWQQHHSSTPKSGEKQSQESSANAWHDPRILPPPPFPFFIFCISFLMRKDVSFFFLLLKEKI